MTRECLREEELTELLTERLSPADRVRLAVHVAECPRCRRRVRQQRIAGEWESARRAETAALGAAGARRSRSYLSWVLLAIALLVFSFVTLEQWSVIQKQRRELRLRGAAGPGAGEESTEELLARERRSRHHDRIHGAVSALTLGDARLFHRFLDPVPEEMRGWEWYRLDHVGDRSLTSDDLGVGPLTALRTAGGYRWIGTANGEILRLDVDTSPGLPSDPLRIAAHQGAVHALAVRADGRLLASGGEDTSVHLWNPETGEAVRELTGAGWSITGVAFTLDGSFVVAASLDGQLHSWNVETGEQGRVWSYETGPVRALGSGGGLLVWGGDDGRVFLDPEAAASGAHQGSSLSHRASAVSSLACAPDIDLSGRIRIAAGRVDGSIELIHQGRDAEIKPRLVGHVGAVLAVVYSGEDRLVSAGMDATVRVWDPISAGSLSVQRGHRGPVRGLEMSPDGTRIVTVSEDGTLRTWALEAPDPLVRRTGDQPVRRIRVAPSGKLFAYQSGDEDFDLLPVPSDGFEASLERMHRGGHILDLDLVGGRVARILDRERIGLERTPLPDAEGDETIENGTPPVVECVGSQACFDPQGHWLAVLHESRLKFLNPETGEEIAGLDEELDRPTLLTVSGHGRVWACLTHGAQVRIWSLDPEPRSLEPLALRGDALALVLSHDGRHLLVLEAENQVSFWELETRDELSRFTVPGLVQVTAVTLSADATRIVTGDREGTIHVWDARDGVSLLSLQHPDPGVSALAFGPRDRILYAGGFEGTLVLWRGSDR